MKCNVLLDQIKLKIMILLRDEYREITFFVNFGIVIVRNHKTVLLVTSFNDFDLHSRSQGNQKVRIFTIILLQTLSVNPAVVWCNVETFGVFFKLMFILLCLTITQRRIHHFGDFDLKKKLKYWIVLG